jgi:hypothetical protein
MYVRTSGARVRCKDDVTRSLSYYKRKRDVCTRVVLLSFIYVSWSCLLQVAEDRRLR